MSATHGLWSAANLSLTWLTVEIRDDANSWINFNAINDYNTGYSCGLRSKPVIVSRSERNRQLIAHEPITIEMDNSPWDGHAYGLWEAPIGTNAPLEVNGGTFSGWRHHPIRIRAAFDQIGATTTLGTWIVDDVVTRGDRAFLSCKTILSLLGDRSAETLKNGGHWHLGASYSYLFRLLLDSALIGAPSIVTVASGITQPVYDDSVPSSWGPCPGQTAADRLSVYRWIPRCMCKHPTNANVIFVGFMVPGADELPDGAIASLDISTGFWTILAVAPASTHVQQKVPVSMVAWDDSGTIKIAAMCAYEVGSTTANGVRWRIVERVFNATTGAQTASSSIRAWWPALESVRKGIDYNIVGKVEIAAGYMSTTVLDLGSTGYHGEPVVICFPQHATETHRMNYNMGSTDLEYRRGYWESYGPLVGDHAPYSEEFVFNLGEVSFPVGSYGMFIQHTPGTIGNERGFFRYYMSTAMRGRPLLWRNRWYMIGKDSGTDSWQLESGTRGALDSDLDTDAFTLGGTEPMFDRQILAWCLAPNSSTTTFRAWVSTIEWDETYHASNITWSAAKLHYLSYTVSTGTLITSATGWSELPVGNTPTNARMIVDLCTAPYGAVGSELVARPFIGVVLDKVRNAGQAYGIWVGYGSQTSPSTVTTIQMFGSAGYTGPTSGMPFSGFHPAGTPTADSAIFRFVDQASGVMWQATVLAAPTPGVVWERLADGRPMHPVEHHVSTDYGIYVLDSGSRSHSFVGMAPGLLPPLVHGHWYYTENQPSGMHKLPGLYPLCDMSTKRAPVVECADFGGMKVQDALESLLETVPDYRCRLDTSGNVFIEARAAGTSAVTLRPMTEIPHVDAVNDDEMLIEDGYERRLDYDDVATSVEVVPYEVSPNGKPNVEHILRSYSRFAGDFAVRIRTNQPLRMQILAAHGMDPAETGSTDAMKSAGLFYWRRIAETAHCRLATAALASAVTVQVRGITVAGNRYYLGEQEILGTGTMRVMDGDLRNYTVTGLGTAPDSIAIQSTTGAIGVDAPEFAEVTLYPSEAWSSSDGPNGVATLVNSPSNSDTTMLLSDVTQIAAGMVIGIDLEYIEITRVYAASGGEGWVTVRRGKFGTTAASHTSGTTVRAYLSIRRVNRLYPIGATGVWFGVAIDDQQSLDARRIHPGEGVLIETTGYSLQAVKHASARFELSAGIAAMRGTNKDRKIQNRFIDGVMSEHLAETIAQRDKDPRIVLSGVRLREMLPTLTAGDTVTVNSARAIPSGSSETFEVMRCAHDLESLRTEVDLRAYDVIDGAGDSPATAGSEAGGVLVGAGRQRRRET